MLGILRTVLFAPEDLALVRGDPGERRRFLDDLLVARHPRYAGGARGLRAGAAAALGAAEDRGARPAVTCAPWTSGTATSPQHGAALLAGRLELVARAGRAPAAAAFAEVAPTLGADRLRLPVEPGAAELGRRDPAASCEPLLLDALARVRRQEVERGVCLVGPHRDDLELRLGDGPAKGYASHGESWALALALRLAVLPAAARRRRRAGADPRRRVRRAGLAAPRERWPAVAARRRAGAGDRRGGRGRAAHGSAGRGSR